MKTHSGAKKRFRLLASGKIKRKKQHKRHLLVGKSSKNKRHLGKTTYIDSSFVSTIQGLLGG